MRAISVAGTERTRRRATGNHGRFLFDFGAESIVLRLTEEAAPRILYAFEGGERGEVGLAGLAFKVRSGDIRANELILGGPVTGVPDGDIREALAGAMILDGARAAVEEACQRVEARVEAKGAST
jgi:CRISPR-associated protein Cst2